MIEATSASDPDDGDPTLSFYYNSMVGNADGNNEPVTGAAPGLPDADGDIMPTFAEIKIKENAGEFFIWYDSTNSRLVVNGRVAVDGDISIIAGNGQNHTINYEGQGSMLAYAGDANPDGGHVVLSPNLYTTGFPVTNSIGIMAEVNFKLGIDAGREIMGGFYSQGTISMNKQTTLAGTIVGTNFDMAGQVPDIYQVPRLRDSWIDEQHMIGVNPNPVGQILGQSSGNIFFVFGVPL
jgi:hypothetical protein